jgi:uncharacterized cupin superfamily protein
MAKPGLVGLLRSLRRGTPDLLDPNVPSRLRISKATFNLTPGALPEEWILKGAPLARSACLSRNRDLSAATVVWDCTAGEFSWHYDIDETIYILEGDVFITAPEVGCVHLGVGDSVYFSAGTRAIWRIPKYVRKVAFFKHPAPLPVSLGLIGVTKLRRLFRALFCQSLPSNLCLVWSVTYLT